MRFRKLASPFALVTPIVPVYATSPSLSGHDRHFVVSCGTKYPVLLVFYTNIFQCVLRISNDSPFYFSFLIGSTTRSAGSVAVLSISAAGGRRPLPLHLASQAAHSTRSLSSLTSSPITYNAPKHGGEFATFGFSGCKGRLNGMFTPV